MTRHLEIEHPAPTTNPFSLFEHWYDAATGNIPAREVVALATATRAGRPSVRMVLLRGFDATGFRFYTNYQSRKGQELAENPHAALCFHWESIARQVRIEGSVERLSAEESDAYFGTRTRESCISARVSPQSHPIDSPEALEAVRHELTRELEGRVVHRPETWGGFLLLPERYEFCIQGEHRLHERGCYVREPGGWSFVWLAP
jgi:pyridoxamine 5'-phosphate oxidase